MSVRRLGTTLFSIPFAVATVVAWSAGPDIAQAQTKGMEAPRSKLEITIKDRQHGYETAEFTMPSQDTIIVVRNQDSVTHGLRRFLNWSPMGLTYAFLYMGRYNLNVAKNALGDLMTKEDFGIIFGAGTITYGIAFLLNGPLTDKIGGKWGILISAFGSTFMNLVMGFYLSHVLQAGDATNDQIRLAFSLLYAGNMYFQSFGAVAIVKVNASWFHVRERGGFSGIFGTMISSGIFFAFTVNAWVLEYFQKGLEGSPKTLATRWVFYLPAIILLTMGVIEVFLLRDRPSQAGHEDFDTGDANLGDGDVSTLEIMKKIFTNPIVLTVWLIEFCTGVLRNGVMQWYPTYVKEVFDLPSSHYLNDGNWSDWRTIVPFFVLAAAFIVASSRVTGKWRAIWVTSGGLLFLAPFLQGGWGGIQMVAGVIGGNVAGYVSDIFFQSRRAPAAGGLYWLLFACVVGMIFPLGTSTNTLLAAPPKTPILAGDKIVAVDGKEVSDWERAACLPMCAGRLSGRRPVRDQERQLPLRIEGRDPGRGPVLLGGRIHHDPCLIVNKNAKIAPKTRISGSSLEGKVFTWKLGFKPIY